MSTFEAILAFGRNEDSSTSEANVRRSRDSSNPREVVMSSQRVALVGVLFAMVGSSAECGATVSLKGTKLVVKCDDTPTVILVDGMDRLGEVTVFVDSDPVGQFNGIRDIDVKGGDGGDSLFVGGIRIGGTLKAKLANGDDFIAIGTARSVAIDQQSVFIGQNVDLSLGGQAGDVVRVDVDSGDFGITIGRDFVARDVADFDFDGEGETNAFDVEDITIGGQLKLRGKLAADLTGDLLSFRMTNVNVAGATTIELGAGDDKVRLADCSFGGKLTAKLGAGDDTFEAGLSSNTACVFFGAASIRGGSGDADSITMNSNEFVQPVTVTQFEAGP